MKGVVIKKIEVEINFSADQLELYTSLPGANDAARAISVALQKAINTSSSARDV
jgi:hypothetical protein